ncbi:hypothetical protein BEST7003_3052 [Bacillus subtilis BEST7003]|nr:hypothetical protein BEST7613_6309 [Bacillus subtilis BEST7613]BAM59253.1 hypothetical protein BEST7003_3052 [Bacillus subtilis BEST7003]BBK73926.1 hypothetical protein NBRC13719_32710 [Bacillus subtilis subsp. subtilis]BCV72236.1 hypothetical protein BsBEST3095_32570 [Bacillus subtilis]BEV40394.1 hypothetical protein BSB_34670 [Bacillus stercoris]
MFVKISNLRINECSAYLYLLRCKYIAEKENRVKVAKETKLRVAKKSISTCK